MLRVFVVCYLVCLLAAVRHFLNSHHLIVAHISGLLTTHTHNYQNVKHSRNQVTQTELLI